MSIEETVEIGIAFAERAAKHDKNAIEGGNQSLCQRAITDYTRAMEMFSLASTHQHNAITKQLLRDKIVGCRDRKVVLQEYLTTDRAAPMSRNETDAMRVEARNEERPAVCEGVPNLFTRVNLSTVEHDSLPSLKDVVGLEKAKEVLQEATMLPERFPDLFEARRTWRTILLYGPTGVGKTLLSKAIARESKRRLLALTGGDVMAGCVEECEKTVKDVFTAAKRIGNAVFYLDEIDMVFSTERSHEGERVRRVQGQFLKELQTLQECANGVVFIATSRRPWVLEEALLRRMDKRVHIGLPNALSRAKMLEALLREVRHTLSREDMEHIATECETYSGSDMKVLVMEAEMEPLRVIQDASHFRNVCVERDGEAVELVSPCGSADDGAVEMKYTDVERSALHISAVSCLDFELALDRTRPTVGRDTIQKHVEFTRGKGEKGW